MKHVIPTGLAAGAAILANPIRARGIARVSADGSNANTEATKILNELKSTFEAFKAERDKEIADLKKGLGDVVQTEKVDRINAEITKLQGSLDEVNSLIAAIRTGGAGGETVDPAKAEHAKVFDQWFRGRGGVDVENKLRELEVKNAARTDSDPDGGYIVPDQMETTIDRVLTTVSAMRNIANVITISSESYKKPVNTGGTDTGWVGERQARTETNTSKLNVLEFPAMELYANPAATQKMLDDAMIDVAAWLSDEVGIVFAEQEGAAFWTGDGVNQPRGISKYTMIADSSYAWGKIGFKVSGVAAALSDSSNNGVDALIDLVYSLKQGYRQNARFAMNRATQGTVRKFKDTYGQYLWQPSAQAGQPASLLGYPVTDDDNVPDIAANAFPVWFGDFKRAYLIVDRAGIRVLRDPYTNKPYVHFYTTKRVGGGVQNFEAVKALKVST